MQNKKNFKKGFGLLEVLISIVIIITILAALVFVGRASLANSGHTQERAQAIYLAQEGIEIVRQIRDTNWIDKDNKTQWNTLAYQSPPTESFSTVNVNGCYNIVATSSTGIYRNRFGLYNLGTFGLAACKNIKDSNWEDINIDGMHFKRAVFIDSMGLLNIGTISTLKVTVLVQWKTNGSYQASATSVSEVMTDWRPNY